MQKLAAAGAFAVLLVASAAQAQPIVYTWTGFGTNVPGSSKCLTYKMTINVTVDGKNVKGTTFQQEGRTERTFVTTLDENGGIKTTAKVGGGRMMDVVGTVKEGAAKIMLDGYCKFEGPLTKK
jgi:hypothetical protein